MKIIFSSISRLVFSYSKFFLMLTMLSTLGSPSYSNDNSQYTYLKCNDGYFRLSGEFLDSNYNIRTRKFTSSYKVYQYTTNYISLPHGYSIDRNNGEYKSKEGKVICVFEIINFNQLPKLNEEGKLF